MTLVGDKPTSKSEQPPLSRWGYIARLAIAEWLQACIDGNVSQFYRQWAPYSKRWKIRTDTEDKDPDYPLRRDNPLERPINISRFFDNTQENPPQILIRDGGWQRVSTNLGGFTFGFPSPAENGTQNVGILDDVPVSVEMTCAAMDENDCTLLVNFCEEAFGPTGTFHHRGMLSPRDPTKSKWAVFLPLSSTSVGAMSNTSFAEDRQKQIWTQTVTLECRVESVRWAKYKSPIYLSGSYGVSDPTLTVPSTMRVGEQTRVLVSRRPPGARLITDNFRRALVLENDYLFAKRKGDVVVSLQHHATSEVFATVDITITA